METKQDNINDIKYYRLSNGLIFKYDKNSKNFYYLNKNNTWTFYAPLVSIFFDSASDYDEITVEQLKKEVEGRSIK